MGYISLSIMSDLSLLSILFAHWSLDTQVAGQSVIPKRERNMRVTNQLVVDRVASPWGSASSSLLCIVNKGL